jgi:hypothetical protein
MEELLAQSGQTLRLREGPLFCEPHQAVILRRMESQAPEGDSESQQRFEELNARVAANRADLDALQARIDAANHRADASEARADASQVRANASQVRASQAGDRIDKLEARADVDGRMIAELQVDGVLSSEHAAHMEEALRSSRKIGAAIGVVMAGRKVSEEVAFEALVRASNNTNRKGPRHRGRGVRTGDVSDLPDK